MSFKVLRTQRMTESLNVTHGLYKYLAVGTIATGLGHVNPRHLEPSPWLAISIHLEYRAGGLCRASG